MSKKHKNRKQKMVDQTNVEEARLKSIVEIPPVYSMEPAKAEPESILIEPVVKIAESVIKVNEPFDPKKLVDDMLRKAREDK